MRLARSAVVLSCLLFLGGLSARAARAEGPARAMLSWVRLPGAEACATAPSLAEAVERRVGQRVFTAAPGAELSMEGWVEPAPRPLSWRAVVTVADARGAVLGTREILSSSEDCNDVMGPLSLALALMVDPQAAAEDDRAGTGAVEVQVTTAGSGAGGGARLSPGLGEATALRRGSWLQVSMGSLVGAGATPGIDKDALGFGALVRLAMGTSRVWGLVTEMAFLMPKKLDDKTTARGHLAVLGCPLRWELGVRLEACAGFDSGVLFAGIKPLRSNLFALLDGLVSARVGHRVPGSSVLVSLGASLGVPLLRDAYEVSTSAESYLPPPVFGLFDLSLGFEAP